MLEETNDNLSQPKNETDGNLATDVQTNNQAIEQPVEETEICEKQQALNEIEASNAEENEDETLKARHEIPMLDYDTLSMETLVEELQKLVSNEKVMSIRDHVEEIKKAFLSKYNHFIEEKKEEFHAENPESTDEFQYHFPLKSKFDQFYTLYKDNKNIHFKSLQNNLKTNLEVRLAIVEELKELINPNENIKDTLKHFNELRERWKNAGAIPKDKYNHVWNNYHFHVENFYDYLHLDREARDLDFKHNLEQKQKIIVRVEELLQEQDINKAFRELQDLHRIWKEEIGPVSREHRDEIWNQFSDLTKKMHDKREVLFEKIRGTEQENLEKKNAIIAQIEELGTIKVNAHSQWLVQIEKVEALREAFFSTGKVPADVNEATWAAFKNAVRNFNTFKNSFYKDIKKEQNENLNKKNALVAKANELKDSEDFAATTAIMKQIQEDWKKIGHVPRKYSDKVWAEFKAACNHYFDRLKDQKSEHNAEEMEAFDKKKAYLESIKEFQLIGEHKADLDAIKQHIENWKSLGKVPFTRRHIEGKFNKILDALFDKLSLSKKDSDMMRFANKIENLSESNDSRKLENEKIFIIRKIEELQNEIFQLENNIQFFANTRNAKKENSIVLEVRKNIAIHKESLDTWKEKLKQLRNLNQE
ncbi:MAG: chromosome segregation protein [Flavobacteriales bacterium 32-34-25]|nr:MAG: chromosome segregation protein [Flavobacteriales bacterium 32-34-25]